MSDETNGSCTLRVRFRGVACDEYSGVSHELLLPFLHMLPAAALLSMGARGRGPDQARGSDAFD